MQTIRGRGRAAVLVGLGLIAGGLGCGSIVASGADGAAGAAAGTGVGGAAPGMGGASGATGGAGAGGAGAGSGGTGGTGGALTGGAGTGGGGTGGASTDGGGAGDAPSCPGGMQSNGTCVPYPSCRELHAAEPALASGPYPISPSGNVADIFTAYCDMTTAGGGWTLVLNDGPSFAKQTTGITTDTCYTTNCTNRAYSTAPIYADLMIDAANQDIVAEAYAVRVVITGVHPATVGKTVRQLFIGPGPFYAEKEDNSNVQTIFPNAGSCSSLPQDFAAMVCGTFVITFSDPGWDTTTCSEGGTTLTVGGSTSYTEVWYNCAGWPENPNHMGFDYYPDNMRFWVR